MEGISSILSDDADSVSAGLPETGAVMVAEIANRLHDALEVFRCEVGRSKVLNHVVHDKESKLQALLLLTLVALRNDLIAKSLNEWIDELLVRLEEDAHQFSSGDL